MSIQHKVSTVSAAIALAIYTLPNAYAEENNIKKKKEEKANVEVIEVTGYRGSIQRSLNAKRLADNVQDSIFAEDIGKSTDQNIADALSRVTGVTVQEEDGEGTRISVRGAGASLNQISLNGVALTSSLSGSGSDQSQADQSVDLSTFSSDILSHIDVIKTAAADHDEGSLGANVILRTIKPLLIDKDRRQIEVQSRYNDYAKKQNYKINGTFSEKFLNESLGIIVTAAKETQDSRKDSLGGHWLAPYEVVPVRAGGATTTDGEIWSPDADTNAIILKERSYSTDVNSRERFTMTTGIQFLPTDETDVQLDLSYSKAEYLSDRHSVKTNAPDLTLGNRQNLDSDPQHEWWTINPDNQTLTKSINRHGGGGFGRSIGGNETENQVATLKIDHELTDDLTVAFTAGYSNTDFESQPNAALSTANWNSVPHTALRTATDIEPVGYDCTSGKCAQVVGTQPYKQNPTGNSNGNDNIVTSGFTPSDYNSSHMGYIASNYETSSDTNKSVFLDFDWVVDFASITMVEFGIKWSEREKETFTDYQTFDSAAEQVFGPNGPVSGFGPGDIRMIDVLEGEGLPVEDFMKDLVPDNFSPDYMQNGWGLLSPDKAFEAMFSLPETTLDHNKDGDRRIQQDNISAYTKLNFEFFDNRLTGNVGVRYVKTDVDSYGLSRVDFQKGSNVFDPFDLVFNQQSINENLDECAPLDKQRWSNVYDELPGPCFDRDAQGGGELTAKYDENGNVIGGIDGITNLDLATGKSWYVLLRHRDFTTDHTDNGRMPGYLEDGTISNPRQMYRRALPTSSNGLGESEVWLPSLNLNYQISDDLIGRFATSKTMARPRFDSLRPGFRYTESIWSDYGLGTIYNPDLKPLESVNIDVSLEWYFSPSGNLSLAYFHKDMENFEESVKERVFIRDIRSDYSQQPIDFDDFGVSTMQDGKLLTPLDTINGTDGATCMPDRVIQTQMDGILPFRCQEVEFNRIRNGANTTTQGVELSYTQNYDDFLPEQMAGFGSTFNYTYAKSESDAEYLELSDRYLKALPQAYTPKHSANTTLYWERNGHQIRLTHRFNSDQLVNRGLTDGASWQDQTQKLDFSASYKYSENILFTFHALNLTDDVKKTYFTSTSMNLGTAENPEILDEGNAMEDDVDESRIISAYKTGRQFRLSARISF